MPKKAEPQNEPTAALESRVAKHASGKHPLMRVAAHVACRGVSAYYRLRSASEVARDGTENLFRILNEVLTEPQMKRLVNEAEQALQDAAGS